MKIKVKYFWAVSQGGPGPTFFCDEISESEIFIFVALFGESATNFQVIATLLQYHIR
jgi:hypothetical protein